MKKVFRLIALILYIIVYVLVAAELLMRGYWEIVFVAMIFQYPIMALLFGGEDL